MDSSPLRTESFSPAWTVKSRYVRRLRRNLRSGPAMRPNGAAKSRRGLSSCAQATWRSAPHSACRSARSSPSKPSRRWPPRSMPVMPEDEPTGPDLEGVIADANAVGLESVVIGGFSVIYHGHIRATKDSDILVADSPNQ